MIRLDLGNEPAELTQERAKRLPAAVDAFNAHGAGAAALTDLLDAGYQVARAELRSRQFGKCAFCEKKEDAFKRPVEHFRPKKGAQDKVNGQWVTVKTHYWWLTWTWANLYFACDQCNMNGHKGSRFPIESNQSRGASPPQSATNVVPAAYYDLSAERRLLVDPRHDNPLDHLEWTPVDRGKPSSTWRWTIAGCDDRGDITIEVLGLTKRVDEVNLHLQGIKLLWQQIEQHLQAGRQADARSCWSDAVAAYVNDKQQPFRNAAWWALNSLCPHAERARHGFVQLNVPCV